MYESIFKYIHILAMLLAMFNGAYKIEAIVKLNRTSIAKVK